MTSDPRIKTVDPLPEKCLRVTFVNNITKIYDCKPLLKEESFLSLEDDVLFNAVKSDQGGYGVIWNEEIDLSESELWLNGTLAEPSTQTNGDSAALHLHSSV